MRVAFLAAVLGLARAGLGPTNPTWAPTYNMYVLQFCREKRLTVSVPLPCAVASLCVCGLLECVACLYQRVKGTPGRLRAPLLRSLLF
jgi:hypothetical protein